MRSFCSIAILLFFTSLVLAQDTKKSERSKPGLGQQVESAVKDLASSDFELREKAQARLKAMGDSARPFLKRHRDHSDPEARLRIRNLLNPPKAIAPLTREDGGSRPRREPRTSPVRPSNPGIEFDPFEIFRRRRANGGEFDNRDLAEMDQSVQEKHRQLMERLQEIMRNPGAGLPHSSSNGNSNHVRSSISLTTPEFGAVRMMREGDSIHLTITPPGGETKSFDAPNVDTFKTKYPQVYERLKGTGIFRQQGFARSWSFSFGGGQPRSPFAPPAPPRRGVTSPFDRGTGGNPNAAPTRPVPLKRSEGKKAPKAGDGKKPKLGATVREQPYKNGADLLVEKVSKGSVAESLGLRKGDVIMRVNGRSVRSMEELRRSVEATRPDAMWSLWVRRGGVVRILASKGCAEGPVPEPQRKRASRDL